MSEIPTAVRIQVEERDHSICRVCGSHVKDMGALHHVEYRSEGGLHVLENLVTVHFMYWPRCHERVHAHKGVFQPLLREVVRHDGLNALQLLRWARAAQREERWSSLISRSARSMPSPSVIN